MTRGPHGVARGDRPSALPGLAGLAGFGVAAALVVAWPMLLKGSPILFWDSAAYLRRGQMAVDTIGRLLVPGDSPGAGGGAVTAEGAAGQIESIRSIPYDIFVHVAAATPLGTTGAVLAQTVIVMMVLRLAIDRELQGARANTMVAALFCATLSPLPWFSSYMMPDLLGAAILIGAIVLVRGVERMGIAGMLVLGGGMLFALLAHYGNIPFAVLVLGAALLLIILQRRMSVRAVALGVGPIALAIAANMIGGALAFDAPSAAPRRLPLLLARSIEDGPARWHLEANCPTLRYAICEVLPTIPDNVGAVMWGPEGISQRATLAQMDRIRAEEVLILRRAFADYPLTQGWALLRNSVVQLTRFGGDDFIWGEITRDAAGLPDADLSLDTRRALFDAAGVASIIGVALSLVGIAVFLWRDGLRTGRREREMLGVALFGLLANAAIFGGLSAPVDRYQGRVVWILPVLAALFWLERRRAARA